MIRVGKASIVGGVWGTGAGSPAGVWGRSRPQMRSITHGRLIWHSMSEGSREHAPYGLKQPASRFVIHCGRHDHRPPSLKSAQPTPLIEQCHRSLNTKPGGRSMELANDANGSEIA